MHLPSRNILTIGAVAIVVLGGAGYLIWGHQAATSGSGASATSEAESTFVGLAQQLGAISFDTRVLSDPRFTSLVDIRTAILPEATGRSNPFAPLSGLSSGATGASGGAAGGTPR